MENFNESIFDEFDEINKAVVEEENQEEPIKQPLEEIKEEKTFASVLKPTSCPCKKEGCEKCNKAHKGEVFEKKGKNIIYFGGNIKS